jgi:hypothetical protein
MKTKFITIIFILLSAISVAQTSSETPQQNISTDSNVVFRLFSTKNKFNFIKLNTRNGQMSQIQWNVEDNMRFETTLSNISRVSVEEEKNGRFFLYPTTNIYNFILIDQIDGRTWQVQWAFELKDRMVMQIY